MDHDGGEPTSLNGDYDASKDTRFTLMEEVLLLGLKDKEVKWKPHGDDHVLLFLNLTLSSRDTPPSGMTASPPDCAAAFSLSSPCVIRLSWRRWSAAEEASSCGRWC